MFVIGCCVGRVCCRSRLFAWMLLLRGLWWMLILFLSSRRLWLWISVDVALMLVRGVDWVGLGWCLGGA